VRFRNAIKKKQALMLVSTSFSGYAIFFVASRVTLLSNIAKTLKHIAPQRFHARSIFTTTSQCLE